MKLKSKDCKMWEVFFIFNLLYCVVNAVTYNTYTGVLATEEEIAEFTEKNIADICTITFPPCNESEMRRPDGSCNNLKYPSYGSFHTYQSRMLPAEFGENFEPKLNSSGHPSLYARHIRQLLVGVGEGISEKLSTVGAYFLEFVTNDFISIHDTTNFVLDTTFCCKEEGIESPQCAPILIAGDDNVHQFTSIRCFNNTRPLTYQSTGCVSNDTVPARINYATTHFDLSMTYLFIGVTLEEIRTYEGGRLKVEIVNGQSFTSSASNTTDCTIQQATKTSCTRNVPNALLGTNLFTTYFWRHHNMIADALAEQNPCWDDEKLFLNAMDINIACYDRILFYEYFPLILGYENMVNQGIILHYPGFRDIYDESIPPQLLIEFNYALRWFHGTQNTKQKLYDKYGNYVKTRVMLNYTFRAQDLILDDNMVYLTHGLLEQPSADFDYLTDPGMAEIGLAQYQDAFDILSADLNKGRYLGLPSYVKYRDLCTNYTISHKSFEDLRYIMQKSKIDILKNIYGDVNKVEVFAGIWAEDFMDGAMVPPTIACLMFPYLKQSVMTDRHWFERPNRPNAYNKAKMEQIAQTTLASLFCAVGDEVTEIQPEAFRRIGSDNAKVSCDKIPKLDFSAWKDDSCSSTC